MRVIYTFGFKYAGVTSRIAYLVKNDLIILVILGGPHEGFYRELKQVVNHMPTKRSQLFDNKNDSNKK